MPQKLPNRDNFDGTFLASTIFSQGKGKVKWMGDWWLLGFVIACGFTASGLLAGIHRAATASAPSFRLYLHSPLAIAWSLAICMFGGPYLVISQGWHFFANGNLRASALGLLAGLSVIWSFCSGVFVVELLMLLNVIQIRM